jgi:hypothetical protein
MRIRSFVEDIWSLIREIDNHELSFPDRLKNTISDPVVRLNVVYSFGGYSTACRCFLDGFEHVDELMVFLVRCHGDECMA